MISSSTVRNGETFRWVVVSTVLFCSLLTAVGALRAGPVTLTLEGAIELALESDEMLRQASEAVTGARADVLEAKSNAMPHLTIAGQYGRNVIKPSFFLPEEFRQGTDMPARVDIGEDNDFVGAATLTQVLWAAGRVSAGLSAAREFLSSYSCREATTADYVRFGAREAYFGALLAAEFVRISEKALEETEEATRVAQAGYRAGTVSRFDVMRAEVELANRKTPLVKARNDLDQALTVLRRRCGLEPETEIILVDSLEEVSDPPPIETVVGIMRNENAELRGLEHYVEARRQFLRIAKAERYPMLQLSANYGIQTQWSGGTFPEEELVADNASIAIGFQIPIFDGLSAKGKIGRAEADLRTAEIELARVERDKALAVRQAWLSLENAITALEGRVEAVRLAEEAHRLSIIRLENGLATPLERLDAELAMTTARGQLAEALYTCKISEAYLELSVGSADFLKAVTGDEEGRDHE